MANNLSLSLLGEPEELLEISKFHANTPSSLKFKTKNKSRRYVYLKIDLEKKKLEFDNLQGSGVSITPENTPEPYTAMKFCVDDTLDTDVFSNLDMYTRVYLFSLVRVNRIRQVHHKYRANDTLRIYLQLGRGPNS